MVIKMWFGESTSYEMAIASSKGKKIFLWGGKME